MIFDTDVLIWASRGSEKAARAIDAAPDRALAIVSLMELLQDVRSKLEARSLPSASALFVISTAATAFFFFL